jgi:DNA-binding transcriptional LysR family regulator
MTLKQLYRMAVFAKVAEHGSFSAAAAALGLGKAVVSEHVRALELAAGAQLLNRSPRAVALTEEGRRFYAPCRRIVELGNGAFLDLDESRRSPRGAIRLSAPYQLGLTFLVGRLQAFRALYPEVAIELVLDDGIVNVIEGGYDLALRVGWLRDTRLRAARLARFRLVLCAGRGYFAQRPPPKQPADLEAHPWVSITRLPHPDRLTLQRRGQRRSVRLVPAIKTNSGLAARRFILAGAGIGALPDYGVRQELDAGDLIPVLPEWSLPEGVIAAVFPQREPMALRLRRLLDFLRAEFSRHYRE